MTSYSSPQAVIAIIPAAGVGSRMNSAIPKQYLKIKGICILQHTLEKLLSIDDIDLLVLAVSKNDPYLRLELGDFIDSQFGRIKIVDGGNERADSVLNGLNAYPDIKPDTWALVHDAARPCVDQGDIRELISTCKQKQTGGLLAVPVVDTMKRAKSDSNTVVEHTVERSDLWHAQTPQMFKMAELKQALEYCQNNEQIVTDEASAMEALNKPVNLVKAHSSNIKITQADDLELAAFYLSQSSSKN